MPPSFRGAVQPGPGIPGGVDGGPGIPKGYLEELARRETGGQPNPELTRSGASSAAGRFQMTRGTLLETYRRAFPESTKGLNDAQLEQQFREIATDPSFPAGYDHPAH
jgi:hypothetical protein